MSVARRRHALDRSYVLEGCGMRADLYEAPSNNASDMFIKTSMPNNDACLPFFTCSSRSSVIAHVCLSVPHCWYALLSNNDMGSIRARIA